MKVLFTTLLALVSLNAVAVRGHIGYMVQQYSNDGRTETDETALTLLADLEYDKSWDTFSFAVQGLLRDAHEGSDRDFHYLQQLRLRADSDRAFAQIGVDRNSWSILEVFHPVDTFLPSWPDVAGEQVLRLARPELRAGYSTDRWSLEVGSFIRGRLPKQLSPNVRASASGARPIGARQYARPGSRLEGNTPLLSPFAQVKYLGESTELSANFYMGNDLSRPIYLASSTGELLTISPYVRQLGLTVNHNASEVTLRSELLLQDYTDITLTPLERVVVNKAGQTDLQNQGMQFVASGGIYYSHNYGQWLGHWFAEYIRKFNSPRTFDLFANDLTLGHKLEFNDFNSTSLNTTVFVDLDNPEDWIVFIAASSVLDERWTLEMGLRILEFRDDSRAFSSLDGLDYGFFQIKYFI